MYKLFFSVILLTSPFLSFSQTLDWAKHFATGSDWDKEESFGEDVCVDSEHNVYTLGSILGMANFNPDGNPVVLGTTGTKYIFLIKHDSSGNFVFAKLIGSASTFYDSMIKCDSDNNLIIGTNFYGSLEMPGLGPTLIGDGSLDFALIKLDNSGNLIWAHLIGGSGIEELRSIAIDESNNILTSSWLTDTIDVDPGSGTINIFPSSSNSTDLFVLKLTSLGNFIWVKTLTGPSNKRPFYVSTDPENNVILTGYFVDTLDFNPGIPEDIHVSNNSIDLFIIKLDSSGVYTWGKSITGDGYLGKMIITAKSIDEIYIGGGFSHTRDFDPGVDVYELTSVGNNDVFLLKLNGSGDFQWVVQEGSSGYDYLTDISYLGSNNVIISGGFNGISLSCYKSDGSPVWDIPNNEFKPIIRAVETSSDSIIWITGSFNFQNDFDPSSDVFNLSPYGTYQEAFTLKLELDDFALGEGGQEYPEWSIYPNPSNSQISLVIVDYETVTIRIYDLAGQLLYSDMLVGANSFTINPNLKPGTYIMETQSRTAKKYFTIIRY